LEKGLFYKEKAINFTQDKTDQIVDLMTLASHFYYGKNNDLLKKVLNLSSCIGIELEALLLSFYNYPYK
jgi:hypothetical protein